MANKYFLSDFPAPEELRKKLINNSLPKFREVNGHIHTPYSFSAFPDIETIFRMAKDENITILGINDFFVTDGYETFHNGSLKNKIFPLFNIEFIGLLKEEQKKGIRINDPNNPGRIYFCGKGLDYPFSPGLLQKLKLNTVIRESQFQIKAMITKLNKLIEQVNPSLILFYEDIKKRYAHDLVRERHLAKALRSVAENNYPDPGDRLRFIELVYGGKKSKSGVGNTAMLENEIRSNLLKSGGAAFVEENKDSFLGLGSIIKIILKAGGIPCYPVLLDDPSGNYTEFENDKEKLHKALSASKIGCIELIPGRNSLNNLRDFVKFFYKKNYLITFGTEHNTPEMIPLTVSARGSEMLDNELKQIAWESACVIAAHQYLRAQGMQGYVLANGTPSVDQKRELIILGKLVIEFYLSNN
jgi:hypothetical protein